MVDLMNKALNSTGHFFQRSKRSANPDDFNSSDNLSCRTKPFELHQRVWIENLELLRFALELRQTGLQRGRHQK